MRMDRRLRYKTGAAEVLASAALVFCILMAVHSIRGGHLVGCGAGSSCDSVLGGKWSTLFGILPVSGLAAGVYLAFLFALGVFRFSKDDSVKDLASKALLVLCGAIVGAAVWFIGLQVFAEGTFCKYCMTAHALGLACAALIAPAFARNTRSGWSWAAAGVGLAALMAAVQVITTPDSVYQDGRGEEQFPMITAAEAPVLGDPDAEYVVDLLFDYQCSHCRKVHEQLPEVISRLGGRVAFVLCPCPLSPKCNPYVPREETRFEGSCDLARLALAVYMIKPSAFPEFDAWLFAEGEDGWRPRSVVKAREQAAALVGEEQLSALLPELTLSEILRRTTDLFGRTTTRGNGGIPRFVYGDRWVVPSADSAEDLVNILADTFDIR